MLVSGVGLMLGLPSLRLKELYLLISTLAAQFFFDWFLRTEQMAWFTGRAYAEYAPPLKLRPLDLSYGYPLNVAVAVIASIHFASPCKPKPVVHRESAEGRERQRHSG